MAWTNSGSYVPAGASGTHAFTVTVPSGTNRKLSVAYARETAVTVSTLTFDDTVSPVSFLANARASVQNATDTNIGIVVYDYDIPDGVAAGTYDVDYTLSASNGTHTMLWVTGAGIAAGAPEDTATAEWTTTSTNATGTVTSTDDAELFGVAITGAAAQTWEVTGSVTEAAENNETNYTTVLATGTASGAGDKTFTGTVNTGGSGNKALVLLSYAVVLGPTITTQPTADTAVVHPSHPASFTVDCAAAITSCAWELEDSVGAGTYSAITSGVGGFVIDTTLGTGTSVLTYTPTATTHTGKRIRAKPTDAGGTTTSDAVALTVRAGATIVPTTTTTDEDAQVTGTAKTDVQADDAEMLVAFVALMVDGEELDAPGTGAWLAGLAP